MILTADNFMNTVYIEIQLRRIYISKKTLWVIEEQKKSPIKVQKQVQGIRKNIKSLTVKCVLGTELEVVSNMEYIFCAVSNPCPGFL